MAYRIVAGIIGLFFFVQGVNWIFQPAVAAKGLGMPLLDGVGRSTQIGDLSSFFLCLGTMGILGAVRSNPQWLQAAAMLLGCAAIMRSLAWLLHEAPFATEFIGAEVVLAVALLLVGSRFDRPSR